MSIQDQIAELKARRAERLKEKGASRDEQELADRQRLEELELERGSERVDFVEVERFIAGFPVLVIVRLPNEVEFKAYQDRVATKEDDRDVIKATTDLGRMCVLHPDREGLAKLEEQLPGITVAAGGKAASMCGAKAKAEGKR